MEIVTFPTEAEAMRFVAAVEPALGKTYPIPGFRNGKRLPAGQGETVEYVSVMTDGAEFAVQVTPEMVPLDGRVETVDGSDVTILTDTRREALESEEWAAITKR